MPLRKFEKKPLSARQLKAIEMLMDIENPKTNAEIGFNRTLEGWKQQPAVGKGRGYGFKKC